MDVPFFLKLAFTALVILWTTFIAIKYSPDDMPFWLNLAGLAVLVGSGLTALISIMLFIWS